MKKSIFDQIYDPMGVVNRLYYLKAYTLIYTIVHSRYNMVKTQNLDQNVYANVKTDNVKKLSTSSHDHPYTFN